MASVPPSIKLLEIPCLTIWERKVTEKPDPNSRTIQIPKGIPPLPKGRKHVQAPQHPISTTNFPPYAMGVVVGSPRDTPMKHANISRKGCLGSTANVIPSSGKILTFTKRSGTKSIKHNPNVKDLFTWPHLNHRILKILVPKVRFVVMPYLILTLTLFPLSRASSRQSQGLQRKGRKEQGEIWI